MVTKKVAAIDFGSNAVRFVIAEINDSGELKVLSKYREPVRLGHDVFTTGVISAEIEAKAIKAFQKFSRLIKKHGVDSVKAIATSASREAQNGEHFAAQIREKTGIRLQIIDGIEEAHLVFLAVRHEIDIATKRAVLIDIGGGSVEVTFSERKHLMATESFKMGTVRLVEELKKRGLAETEIGTVLKQFAKPLKHFVLSQRDERPYDFAIGTGGNFDTMGRLKLQVLGQTPNTYLDREELGQLRKRLGKLSFAEKVSDLGLRKDRADVIVPAIAITEMIMDDAKIDRLVIPYVGLKEGLLWQAAESMMN